MWRFSQRTVFLLLFALSLEGSNTQPHTLACHLLQEGCRLRMLKFKNMFPGCYIHNSMMNSQFCNTLYVLMSHTRIQILVDDVELDLSPLAELRISAPKHKQKSPLRQPVELFQIPDDWCAQQLTYMDAVSFSYLTFYID